MFSSIGSCGEAKGMGRRHHLLLRGFRTPDGWESAVAACFANSRWEQILRREAGENGSAPDEIVVTAHTRRKPLQIDRKSVR